MDLPRFYSFRRCPYAMRARLALVAAGVQVALREIRLRDKPAAFLAVSPSATVPCLVTGDGVIDESRDIMLWALRQHDPRGWLRMPPEGHALIDRCDGPFKAALDRAKYANRYPGGDPLAARAEAAAFLAELDARLVRAEGPHLMGAESLADAALLPFVRQFALIDRAWFDAQGWPHLRRWLDQFLASADFAAIIQKYPVWSPAAAEQVFPPAT